MEDFFRLFDKIFAWRNDFFYAFILLTAKYPFAFSNFRNYEPVTLGGWMMKPEYTWREKPRDHKGEHQNLKKKKIADMYAKQGEKIRK